MGRSEMRGNEVGRADTEISPEVESQTAELVGARAREDERSGRRFGASRVLSAADRERIVEDARKIEFPTALRG